jgi:hypothetical protein
MSHSPRIYKAPRPPKHTTNQLATIDPDDTISIDDAKKRFHEYYNEKSPTRIGRFRAKVGDIRYRKPDEYILYPDSPGSAKYLLPDGPRKYDMMGIDVFPPEQEYVDYDDPDYGKVRVKLLGKPVTKDGVTYRDYFKEKYNSRRKMGGDLSSDRETRPEHLVDSYWKQYKKIKENTQYAIPRHRSCRKSHNEEGRTIVSFREDTSRSPRCDFRHCKNLLFITLTIADLPVVYIDAGFRCYNGLMEEIPFNRVIVKELIRQGYIASIDNIERYIGEDIGSDRGHEDLYQRLQSQLQWIGGVFRWIVYYRVWPRRRGHDGRVYRLHMATMEVYDDKKQTRMGTWSKFLKNRDLKPSDLIPFRIVEPSSSVPEMLLGTPHLDEGDYAKLVENPKRIVQYIPFEMKLDNIGYQMVMIDGKQYYFHRKTRIVVEVDVINRCEGHSHTIHIRTLRNISEYSYRRCISGKYDMKTGKIEKFGRLTERTINNIRKYNDAEHVNYEKYSNKPIRITENKFDTSDDDDDDSDWDEGIDDYKYKSNKDNVEAEKSKDEYIDEYIDDSDSKSNSQDKKCRFETTANHLQDKTSKTKYADDSDDDFFDDNDDLDGLDDDDDVYVRPKVQSKKEYKLVRSKSKKDKYEELDEEPVKYDVEELDEEPSVKRNISEEELSESDEDSLSESDFD